MLCNVGRGGFFVDLEPPQGVKDILSRKIILSNSFIINSKWDILDNSFIIDSKLDILDKSYVCDTVVNSVHLN